MNATDHLSKSKKVIPGKGGKLPGKGTTCKADLKVKLPSSKSNKSGVDKTHEPKYMLPFHLAFNRTSSACMGAPQMAYASDLAIWNYGRMDCWNTAR